MVTVSPAAASATTADAFCLRARIPTSDMCFNVAHVGSLRGLLVTPYLAMVVTVEPLLGTRAEVSIAADSEVGSRAIERVVVDDVARLERVFSVFDTSSALHDFRRTGTTDSAELRAVIDLATRWQTQTGGAFHSGAQPLVDLWDRAESLDEVPPKNDVAATVAMIAAARPVASLNLNAIAKGWIADRALTAAVQQPAVSGGWISLGGDVVHRGAGAVTVGIEDPARPYDNVAPQATAEISNEALATSGGARRWWTIGDQRFPKVLDPRSGWPVDRIASATIIAPDGATADVLATVAVVLEPAETIALAGASGAECYLVHHDGSITSSSDRFRPS